MLTIPTFCNLATKNPFLSQTLICSPKSRFPNQSLRFCSKFILLMSSSSPPVSQEVVVEYAKSKRSSCKNCQKPIPAKELRLGVKGRDPRGFDATKWHHLDCFFNKGFDSVVSAEAFSGFSLLEITDQEKLKNLVAKCVKAVDEVSDSDKDAVEGLEEEKSNQINFSNKDDDTTEDGQSSSKKIKLSILETKVVVDYAKSNRSSCKICQKPISAKALRLGLNSRDPRGFDATKWHHLDCFFNKGFDSDVPAEDFLGFSSLESIDQEKLRNLSTKCVKVVDEVSICDKDAVERSAEETSKQIVSKNDDDTTEDGQSSSKKIKLSRLETKVLVDYAKSNRSSCKICQKPISAKELRLGLKSRDPRGYDATKWQHLDCFFNKGFDSVVPAEDFLGFSSLEIIDQEKLKNLVAKCVKAVDEVSDSGKDAVEGLEEEKSKQISLSNKDGDTTEDGQSSSKKIKLSTFKGKAEIDIAFSVYDVESKYKDATLLPRWKAFQTLIFLERDDGLRDSSKIAAFDFDGTLANTSVKKVGANAWSLLYPSIPEKLQNLYNDGYKLVIFTNEANIEIWKNTRQRAVDSKIGRLNSFIELLKGEAKTQTDAFHDLALAYVFIACGKGKGNPEDPYRKPNTGMWHIMKQHFNSGISIDMDQSFYVGDAAARRNDHSDADITFAKTIGLKFYVPEDYFST